MLRLFNYKIFSVVIFIAVLWLGISAIDVALQRKRIGKEVHDLNGKIDVLDKENQFLSRSEEYFKSKAFLERQARLKMNYKLPGEQVVFVYEGTASGQARTFEEELKAMANFKKWWYFLLGY